MALQLFEHLRKIEDLLRSVSSADVANWLLGPGYFPEAYVLPPSFRSHCFTLQKTPYHRRIDELPRRRLEKISYPKSHLTSREFGSLHPSNYHDIVYYLEANWSSILGHLFHPDQKIASYSMPLPLSPKSKGRITGPRAGGLIYQWLTMAEKDLIVDAGEFSFIVRSDIVNFYGSVYTHCIAWALHGREDALKDKKSCKLFGNKIDRLVQYANDARTNGIPIGPALSDLIAEIVLAAVDCEVSRRVAKQGIEFAAARFKDDYRVLCKTEHDGRHFLLCLAQVLSEYNLVLNERKTSILKLPDGLYRPHDRDYFPHSLRKRRPIAFKVFEHTLLIAMDIHRNYPGTSMLEKFVSELLTPKRKELKIRFSFGRMRLQQIQKMIQLLFFAKRESPKLLSHVLGVCEQLYKAYAREFPDLKDFLIQKIKHEIRLANENGSIFEIVWYIFFSRLAGLGIADFGTLVSDSDIKKNAFCKSILTSRQTLFADSRVDLFVKPKDCRDEPLSKKIAAFG